MMSDEYEKHLRSGFKPALVDNCKIHAIQRGRCSLFNK